MKFTVPEYEALDITTPIIEQLAAKSGYKPVPIDRLIDTVAKNMLVSWHTDGVNNEVDTLVETAWTKLFGYEFINANPESSATPMGLMGPPGQGKTTAYIVAMKRIADAMNVALHVNPPIQKDIGVNDLLLRTMVLAGEVTPTPLSGVPYSEGNETRFNPPATLTQLQKTNFATFIGDDALNAHQPVQNALMDIVHTKIWRDTYIGENTYVGITGNLGAADGTNTMKQSSAFINRMAVALAHDTPGAWLQRAHDTYVVDDPFNVGTCFVSDYIAENVTENPNVFYKGPDKQTRGPHASSRSLDALVRDLRTAFVNHDRAKANGIATRPLVSVAEEICSQHVDQEWTKGYVAYVQDLLTLARPAAVELIENNTLSSDMRKKLHDAINYDDGMESERLARALLRLVGSATANRVFDGFHGVISRVDRIKHPNLSEEGEQQLRKEKKQQSVQMLSGYMEACFGTGMIAGGKQNTIMNSVQNVCRDLIARSHDNPMVESAIFGTLDKNKMPIVSQQFFKLLTRIASQFSSDYKNGEALTVVNSSGGKQITALETCLSDSLTATQEAERIYQEATKMGISV
ncbi:hypothetical protein ACNO5E_19485 [Vibrio parahaemolyticus]|uniref:hypothetical protein n=1 Tax=Vibrio parahaemolyticus TaxID=670 RepID=UPI000813A6D0|nr:hypothetical protein [Vibrio parahaemolyticus]OCP68421.1 hypothetical protein AKH08_16555 [Vibrio parahaemolyticus]